jgi:MFS family permease
MLFLTIYVSEHLQMGKPFASACVGVFGVGSALSAVFGGQLADTLGRRPAMLIALFGGATILASLSLITNGWLFMAALFGFALVMEMYRPASSAMIGDVVSPLQRPLAFGLLYLSFNLGFAIAPQIGGWLAAAFLCVPVSGRCGNHGVVRRCGAAVYSGDAPQGAGRGRGWRRSHEGDGIDGRRSDSGVGS